MANRYDKIALKLAAGSLGFGLLFFALTPFIKDLFVIGILGMSVLFICFGIALTGVIALGRSLTLQRAEGKSGLVHMVWQRTLAQTILILILPAAIVCTWLTWVNFPYFTIKVRNESASPMESVRLSGAPGNDVTTITLGVIAPGRHKSARWFAGDEEGVRFHALWRGKTVDFDAVGYITWESTENIEVRLTSKGEIEVEGGSPETPQWRD